MNIIAHELICADEIISRLKTTKLKGFGQPEVYRNATLEIVRFNIDDLIPTQRYVLSGIVNKIIRLADAFRKTGIDAFGLREAVMFWPDGTDPKTDPPIPFLPPIIELSFEANGSYVPLINDGMHRIYTAKLIGLKVINTVYIHRAAYPYYAYPLSNGWDDVEEIDSLPEGYQKKAYRNPADYKALFRDFNAVFPGVQKQR